MMTPRFLLMFALLAACDAAPNASHTSSLASDTHYEVRIAESSIGANGHTKHEVFAFGIRADGSVADDAIIIGHDRLGAGVFTRTNLTLGPLGATTYFTACDHTIGGCLGPLRLTLALAADPTTIVAIRDIALVPPNHPSTTAPCRGPGTILYVDTPFTSLGRGQTTVTQWGQRTTQVNTGASPEEIRVMMYPSRPQQGANWFLTFDAYQLPGTLGVGKFLNAQQVSTTQPGHPAMSISAEQGCSNLTGSFEIHELAISTTLDAFTVSFEQFCGGSALLEGCLRYEK